jgi:hypothetical protein
MAIDIHEVLERFRRLKTDRAPWDAHWEEVAAYCAPRRLGAIGPHPQGAKRMARIYNPIGLVCVQTAASSIHGMVMNPAHLWLELRLIDEAANESQAARAWLDDVGKLLLGYLQAPAAAFHTHAYQALEDAVSLGTAVLYFGLQNTGAIYVRCYPIWTCVIAESRYGVVDTVMRESEMTVRQVVSTWGPDGVSPRTREKWDRSKYDDQVKVLHSVRPRTTLDPGRSDRMNMPFETCYIECEAEHLLEEGGVEEMPYVVPRLAVSTGEVYGRGPGMTALPAIKVANEAQRLLLHASEKAVDPPLQVPHEGLVSPVRAAPGGLTFLRARQEIQQLPTSPSLPYAAEWLEALNNEIRTIFAVDQLQFTADFRMTATEVMLRQSEKMRLLAPVLGRLENEKLNPMVTRVFGLLARTGRIPPAPPEIEGMEMRVQYSSPLARAQKQQLAQGFIQAMTILEPLANIDPAAVLGPIDFRRLTATILNWYGVDPDVLKSPEMLEQEARQQQMMQLLQMLPQLGQAAAGGGQGVASLAGAGLDFAQMAQIMAQMQGQAQPAPPLPRQRPGVNAASLAGSLARGAARGLAGASGGPADLVRALQGRQPY